MRGFYKNLAFASIMALVIMQGFIYVTSRAAFSSNELDVLFIEPSKNIKAGERVVMQAMLSADSEDALATVLFTVKNPQQNIEINFEADKQADGAWLANSTWDTANYEPGIYYLSATAKTYYDNGVIKNDFYSPQYEIKLAVNNELNKEENAIEPAEEKISETEEPAMEPEVKGVKVDSSSPEATKDKEESETVKATEPEETEEPELVEESDIILVRPEDKAIINKYNFQIFVQTKNPVNNLNFEFLNAEDPAISTGPIDVPNFNGLHWIKTINLDPNIFIDGRYKLVVNAISDTTETKIFNFILEVK